jgi:hypothetical protein
VHIQADWHSANTRQGSTAAEGQQRGSPSLMTAIRGPGDPLSRQALSISRPGGLAVGGGLRDSPHLPACHGVARGWPFPTKTSGPGDGLLRVSLTIQACNWWPPARTTAVFQRECSVVPSLTHVGQISGREADGLTVSQSLTSLINTRNISAPPTTLLFTIAMATALCLPQPWPTCAILLVPS